jgi:CheY-like chemotaxis protein
VETAGSGEQALERLRSTRYDVIVSDWKMPGLNGMNLYEQLRMHDPAAARRMLFMTGDVVSGTFQEFLQRHGKECLSKPFAIAEFRAAVAAMAG